MKRIAVLGASGFVGSALIEHLLQSGHSDVRAFIRGTGNAWRLARRGIPLHRVDLLNRAELTKALSGCTHVVNCTRNGKETMLDGLGNLLATCQESGVARFVHLSSVAVYGDPPPAASATEDAPAVPGKGTYGELKLKQDEMVQGAARKGLPSLILCPPNISGPYSAYLTGILGLLRQRRFALLEDGSAPCNLIDARNLCHAIELALDAPSANGARLFITDGETVSWRNLIDELIPLLATPVEVPMVNWADLQRVTMANVEAPASVWASVKHLGSSDVREALRKDPLWRRLDTTLRAAVTRLGPAAEDRMRRAIDGGRAFRPSAPTPVYDVRIVGQQLRGVVHSCNLARREIGYVPQISFKYSMRDFRTWYRTYHAVDSGYWDLLEQLY